MKKVKNMEIKDLRNQIDSIDEQMVKLFVERMQIAGKVAEYKKENNLSIYDKDREIEILNKVEKLAGCEFKPYVKNLFSTIMQSSKDYQSKK